MAARAQAAAKSSSSCGLGGGARVGGNTSILINSIAVDLEGAEIEWVTTPSSTPGGYAPAVGELSVQLLTRSPLRLGGHVTATMLPVVGTVSDDIGVEINVAALDLRFRPYVDSGRLKLRHERTYLRRERRDNPNFAPLSGSGDIGIDFSSDVVELLRAIVTGLLADFLGVIRNPLEFDPGSFTSELGGIDGIGAIFAPLIENLVNQPFFGGTMFGVPNTTLATGATLVNTAATPMSDDATMEGSLGLYYDGGQLLPVASILDFTIALDPGLPLTACCASLEPDPRCLETMSSYACMLARPAVCREEVCGNLIDDDADMAVDEAPCITEVCGDGADNDFDMNFDEAPCLPAELCGNFVDDDSDGAIDEPACQRLEICSNLIDDDMDALTDESGCQPVELCFNTSDDNMDGTIDEPMCSPVEICGNGADDDMDTVIDEAACQVVEVCFNRADDDMDGRIDESPCAPRAP